MNRQKYIEELEKLIEEANKTSDFDIWAQKQRRIYELTQILYN